MQGAKHWRIKGTSPAYSQDVLHASEQPPFSLSLAFSPEGE